MYNLTSSEYLPDNCLFFFKMTTSGGGGFCDCGDTEAWKEGPYCQKHELHSSEVVEEEVKMPPELLCRQRLMLVVFLCCFPPYFLEQRLNH